MSERSEDIAYAGWALAVPASLFVVYDTLTISRHTRK